MDRKDFSYTYDYFGYMIQYKNQNIGGAGVIERSKKLKSNLKLYKEEAESTISDILQGRIDSHMLEVIKRIDDPVSATISTREEIDMKEVQVKKAEVVVYNDVLCFVVKSTKSKKSNYIPLTKKQITKKYLEVEEQLLRFKTQF